MKRYVYALYMLGNYDFSKYVRRDLYQKLGGHYTRGSKNNIDIVCYSSCYYHNKLNNYLHYGKSNINTAFEYEKKVNYNMSLLKYLEFVKSNFIGKNYVLILWGHGYTWKFFLPLYKENQVNTNISMEKVQNYNLVDLKYALSKYKIDILVFETCANMSIENIYELKDDVKYLCGNCDYTGYNGIEHKNVIKDNDVEPVILCKNIVDNMDKELCPSFISAKNSIYIKKKLKIIVRDLLKKENQYVINKVKSCVRYNLIDRESIDLGYFLLCVCRYSIDNNIRKNCVILYMHLRKIIYCVPKKRFKKHGCCGVNIYFPLNKKEYMNNRSDYIQLSFNKNNNWIKLLDILHKRSPSCK